MKIGFLVAPFADRSLDEVLTMLSSRFRRLDCIEIGVSYYRVAHCDPPLFAKDPGKRKDFEAQLTDGGFYLSALSAHGNPLHPDATIAEKSTERLRDAIRLMSKLDSCLLRDGNGNPVRVVNCFSGLPAADLTMGEDGRAVQHGKVPGWQVCPWPKEHLASYREQMKFAGGYWKEIAKEAADVGVALAFELHPNFLLHNPETYLELLDRSGDDGTTLGLNLDPSHMFWRNMDPIAVVRYLNKALGTKPIKHVHGKDTYADPYNTSVNGNHSAAPYSDEAGRVWRFVTIGQGWDPVNGAHDLNWWARFVTELQLWGYDHVISIEHEDSRKSFGEGLEKALDVLDAAVNRETPGGMPWV